MRQVFNIWHTRWLSGLLAFGLAMPALGQQRAGDTDDRGDRSTQQDAPQRERYQQERRSNDRQQRDRRQADQQQRAEKMKQETAGWLTVGVDHDGDGRFEAVEKIFAFDLETAREQSQRRQQGSDRRSRERDQRLVSLDGELRDMQKIRMREEEGPYLVGRVRTDQGRTAKVLLGKNEELSKLNLSEGDRIGVQGRAGTVDQQVILVASEVRSGDQRVKVQLRKRIMPEKEQLRGSVIRTRSATFRGHEDPFLVAEIRTSDGERRLVNLGPKHQFDEIDFSDAGDIRVTGHKGRVSGTEALIAEKVTVDGETIKVESDEGREQQRDGETRERGDRDRRFREGRLRDRDLRDRDLRDRGGRFFDREERDRRFDRGERDRRFLDREERERRFDREERERRFLDREEREGRVLDRAERERRFDRGERDRTFLDREGREGRLRDREEREGRSLDRGERERRLLNRGERDDGERDDEERDERDERNERDDDNRDNRDG